VLIFDDKRYEQFYDDILDYLSENDIKGLNKFIGILIKRAILNKGIPEVENWNDNSEKLKILSNYNKILKSRLQMRFVSSNKFNNKKNSNKNLFLK